MAQASPSEEKQEGRNGRREEGKRLASLRPFLPSSLLVVFAIALRLWGITWSLPDERHVLTYHPDEGLNLFRGVLEKGQGRPHLDLDFYNYGGLYFYLWQGTVAVNGAYGFVQRPDPAQPTIPPSQTFGAMILTGRLLTALLGALTAWAVWALGRRLFGSRAGIAAGLLYAVIPAAVIHGHYATVDVPATFFVTVALVFAAKLLTIDRFISSSFYRLIALSGLTCGLAAAAKYNCGLVLFAPLAALWMSTGRANAEGDSVPSSLPPFLPSSLLLLAATLAGFLIGCPGVLINPSGFCRDFTFELAKSREGMGLLFVNTGNGWLYHLTSSLRFGLGMPLLLLSIAALAYAFVRRSRQDWMLLAFFIPYYLVMGWAQVRFLRYIIPLCPIIAVLVARFVTEPRANKPTIGKLLLGVSALVWVLTLAITLAMDRLMTLAPPQDQAYAYIQANVPRGSSIGLVTAPWYYTPPLSPLFTAPATGPAHARMARQVSTYELRPPDGQEWDPKVLDPSPPIYFIVSDIESEDARRIGWKPARPFFTLFEQQYTPTVFENTPSIFGIGYGKPGYVPNDWLYIYPRIIIYTWK